MAYVTPVKLGSVAPPTATAISGKNRKGRRGNPTQKPPLDVFLNRAEEGVAVSGGSDAKGSLDKAYSKK